MPKNESEFKVEFREALQKNYGPIAEVWTNNDMFRAGLPDFNAVWKKIGAPGLFFPIEAKFVKKLPKRESSLLPGVDLSGVQAKFLQRMWQLGIPSMVLIGFEDTAVACPFDQWPCEISNGLSVPSNNTTLAHVRELVKKNLSFEKTHFGWNVAGFFERLSHG